MSLTEEEFKYKPIAVKDLLKQIMNISSLMVDLAFYSVIYGDEGIAKEVLELENKVDELRISLMIQAALASRNVDEAMKSVSLLTLASTLDQVSNAASDIAKIALDKLRFSKDIALELFNSDEILSRVEVKKIGKEVLEELFKKLDIIVDVIALRRGKKWIIEPGLKHKVMKGDILIIAGSPNSVKILKEYVEGVVVKEEDKVFEDSGYKYIMEQLLQIKNTALVMLDLAHMALLMRSEDVAKKVIELEEYTDVMLRNFEEEILRTDKLPYREKLGALGIAYASENVADAAEDLIKPMLKGLEPHPILLDVYWETNERLSVIEMDESDDGKTLSEIGYDRKGIMVLAVRRDDKWFIMPPYSSFVVKAGDVLIIKYYAESEEIVEMEEMEEDREEIIEEIQDEEWEED